MIQDKRLHRQKSKQVGPIDLIKALSQWTDLYHDLLTIPWPQFFGLVGLVYFAINFIFTLAYLIGGDCIENAQPGSFIDAFSFSVQTMATIGYGAMYPHTLYAHILVTFEVLIGLLAVAMATSLLFARFSRPTARVLFSHTAIVCPYCHTPTLMFRIANQRNNWIVEAQVRVSVLLPAELTPEGHSMRRLCDLKLIRAQTPVLALTWTVMHTIDETSPLYGIDAATFAQWDSQVIVSLTGLDETLSQTIHARYVYLPEQLAWNMRFVDVLSTAPNGNRVIDYNHFHDVMPLLSTSTSPTTG
ncbi:MAG: ATP-sensitive inward rectifier potassium channel 10 [Cyanothece sp. SIO1E1]|nr:ATP-sensitive inward rectifier potassium channel 10 [Cyanothece sp. SIO1E1]